MAELPELETLRRELEKESVGKRFKVPEVTGAKLTKRNGNKKVFQQRLEGAKVKSVDRRGPYLVGNLDNGELLLLHLGEKGYLEKVAPRSTAPKGTVLTLAFTQGGQIRLVDPGGTAQAFVAASDNLAEEAPELAAIGLEAGSAERVSSVLQRAEVAFARREAVAAISESLQGMERIRQIVASLRSVARRDQAGEPVQAVALAEVIESVVRTAAHDLKSASARVEIREPCLVLGHRGELVDVVLNLVVNAIQAREEHRPNQVSVELRRDGQTAVIRVADTGKGISASHMKRLFEPFFTTKGPGEGTGLGLSLARNIVLAHGGSIDVQTEAGAGTTFTVRLPIQEPEAGVTSVARGTSRSGKAG